MHLTLLVKPFTYMKLKTEEFLGTEDACYCLLVHSILHAA